jgi:hypothetical protein
MVQDKFLWHYATIPSGILQLPHVILNYMKRNKIIAIILLLIISNTVIGCLYLKKTNSKGQTKKTVYFGIKQTPPFARKIRAFKKDFKFTPHVISWSIDWDQSFPSKTCNRLLNIGSLPFIVWEPYIKGYEEAITLQNILDGDWDEYIQEWILSIKQFQYPVFICFAPDFNTKKPSWSIIKNGNSAKNYSSVFQKIVTMFREEGALNAIWVWSPNITSETGQSFEVLIKETYPGHNYVDWIGISSLKTQKTETNENISDLFENELNIIVKNIPHKPVMISLVAYPEKGGNKQTWIQNIPQSLNTKLTDISMLIYLNEKDENNLQLNSSSSAKEATKEILRAPIFKADIDKLNTFHIKNNE